MQCFRGGSYLRLIDSRIAQLKAQRPSRTCNENEEEEEVCNTATYTLYPAPYTPHPIHYTLHSTRYTLHASRYTLYPAPYTLHLTPEACFARIHARPFKPQSKVKFGRWCHLWAMNAQKWLQEEIHFSIKEPRDNPRPSRGLVWDQGRCLCLRVDL